MLLLAFQAKRGPGRAWKTLAVFLFISHSGFDLVPDNRSALGKERRNQNIVDDPLH